MELTDKQALIKGAIQGCGIGTAIINGIILFFRHSLNAIILPTLPFPS